MRAFRKRYIFKTFPPKDTYQRQANAFTKAESCAGESPAQLQQPFQASSITCYYLTVHTRFNRCFFSFPLHTDMKLSPLSHGNEWEYRQKDCLSAYCQQSWLLEFPMEHREQSRVQKAMGFIFLGRGDPEDFQMISWK